MTLLRKHLQSLSVIDQTPALNYRVRRYFQLGTAHLFRELRSRGLGQADIVLCMIHLNTEWARRVVSVLIGKPIEIGPPCLRDYHVPPPMMPRPPVIDWVMPNIPVRNSTRLGDSVIEFRVGRTREQILQRGVSRADWDRALRRGWIHLAA
jgi:hypothetical protein